MSESSTESSIKKACGLLLIEVVNSNPNGDPDADGEPRMRPDGRGEITPVSVKRKARDLIMMKHGPVWQTLSDRLKLPENEFEIFEDPDRSLSEMKKQIASDPDAVARRYHDARVYGATFLNERVGDEEGGEEGGGTAVEAPPKTGKKKGKSQADSLAKYIKTGVIQFGIGYSINPVQIGTHTWTKRASSMEATSRGMAPNAAKFVRHGLYVMPFFINPSVAPLSGCTEKDIEVFKALIPYLFEHTRSASRPDIRLVHAHYVEHESAVGVVPDWKLLAMLMPISKIELDKPSTSLADYEIPAGIDAETQRVFKVKYNDLISG